MLHHARATAALFFTSLILAGCGDGSELSPEKEFAQELALASMSARENGASPTPHADYSNRADREDTDEETGVALRAEALLRIIRPSSTALSDLAEFLRSIRGSEKPSSASAGSADRATFDWLTKLRPADRTFAGDWAEVVLESAAEGLLDASARHSLVETVQYEARLSVLLQDLKASLPARFHEKFPDDALGLLPPEQIDRLRDALKSIERRMRLLVARHSDRPNLKVSLDTVEDLGERLTAAQLVAADFASSRSRVFAEVDPATFGKIRSGSENRVASELTRRARRLEAAFPGLRDVLVGGVRSPRGPPRSQAMAVILASLREYDVNVDHWLRAECLLGSLDLDLRSSGSLPAGLGSATDRPAKRLLLASLDDWDLERLRTFSSRSSALTDARVSSGADHLRVWSKDIEAEVGRRSGGGNPVSLSTSLSFGPLEGGELPKEWSTRYVALSQQRFGDAGHMPPGVLETTRSALEESYRSYWERLQAPLGLGRNSDLEKRVRDLLPTFSEDLTKAQEALTEAMLEAERKRLVGEEFFSKLGGFKRPSGDPRAPPTAYVTPRIAEVELTLARTKEAADRANALRRRELAHERERAQAAERLRAERRAKAALAMQIREEKSLRRQYGVSDLMEFPPERWTLVGRTGDESPIYKLRNPGFARYTYRVKGSSTPLRLLPNGVL